jgi:choline-glycine betaine transporter
MNLVCTSIFSVIWFSIISGATINYAINVPNSGILEAFRNGYENTIYQLFQNLPLSVLTVPLYFFAVFISFVTAADSTTVAISGICSTGISPDSPESPKYIKIIWGLALQSLHG